MLLGDQATTDRSAPRVIQMHGSVCDYDCGGDEELARGLARARGGGQSTTPRRGGWIKGRAQAARETEHPHARTRTPTGRPIQMFPIRGTTNSCTTLRLDLLLPFMSVSRLRAGSLVFLIFNSVCQLLLE